MDFVSKKKSSNKTKKRDSSLKVVYISSPMKVKTSASKFRTIVQKLTGRDSDISTYMEGTNGTYNNNNNTTDFEILPETYNNTSSKSSSDHHNNHRLLSSSPLSSPSKSSSFCLNMDPPSRESPTSSGSFLEQSNYFPFGGDIVLMNSQIEEAQYLQGIFPSNLFNDSSQLDIDVLGSYDAL